MWQDHAPWSSEKIDGQSIGVEMMLGDVHNASKESFAFVDSLPHLLSNRELHDADIRFEPKAASG